MKRSRKLRYMVYLIPHQLEAMKKLKKKTGVPTAHFIRIAIDEALRVATNAIR